MIANPIGYPIASGNRGRIPRPGPYRPVPKNTCGARMHRQGLYGGQVGAIGSDRTKPNRLDACISFGAIE